MNLAFRSSQPRVAHSYLSITTIYRAVLVGPLVGALVARSIIRTGKLFPLHVHDGLTKHGSEFHVKGVQPLLACLQNVKHPGGQLLGAIDLLKSLSCLFTLFCVYFHWWLLSLIGLKVCGIFPQREPLLNFQLKIVYHLPSLSLNSILEILHGGSSRNALSNSASNPSM